MAQLEVVNDQRVARRQRDGLAQQVPRWRELGEALFELTVERRQLSGRKNGVAVAQHQAPNLIAGAEYTVSPRGEECGTTKAAARAT